MISLGGLLQPGFRQAASCLIELGLARRDLGKLADLVTEVEVTVSRLDAATGSVTIEDRREEDGQWLAADSGLFARWEPIRISADFQTHVDEIFRGYVTRVRPRYPASAGEAGLELTVQDESAALDREHQRKVWGDKVPVTDLAIVTELISPLGLALDGPPGVGQSSRSLSQDATPIGFLRERARANGYELIFRAGRVYFGPMRLSGQPQPAIMLYAGRATNCVDLQVDDDAQKPDAVRFDIAPRSQGTTQPSETLKPDLPVLGRTAAAEEGAGLGTASVWRVSREGDETDTELRARAQALANANSFKLRASAELDGSLYGHVLEVGRTVTLDGAGARYGGTYYVDSVVHRFSADGYFQQCELLRNATGETVAGGAPLGAATSAIAGLFS